VDSTSDVRIDVIDPSTCAVIATIPSGTDTDVDRAVAAARAAFDHGPWRKLTPVERERRLLKLAELLEKNADEFSQIESVNSGRSLFATRKFDVDGERSGFRIMIPTFARGSKTFDLNILS
jgi:phenylacetaldehyde dehydrogenase